MPNTQEAGPKERAIYFLRTLIELIENDAIAADRIEGMSAAEVIALAEAEAAKAVENSQRLKDGE